eukprot:592239-Rhodomonas_salina.2
MVGRATSVLDISQDNGEQYRGMLYPIARRLHVGQGTRPCASAALPRVSTGSSLPSPYKPVLGSTWGYEHDAGAYSVETSQGGRERRREGGNQREAGTEIGRQAGRRGV